MTAHETTVCVVGAGPVGLVAAIALARARVPFVLVDADEGPVVESRAIIVHAGMLEVLDDLGVAGDLVARGWRVPSVHVALGDRVLGSVSLAHVSGRFPFILTVPQSTTETVLRRRLADLGQEPLAGHTVTGLTRHGDVHEVTGTARDGGPFTVRCRHVIGADGRRSAIRAALGVRLPRNPYPQLIHLADVTLSAPPEANGLYTHLSAQGMLLLGPLPGDRWRIIASSHPSPGTAATAPPPPDRQDLLSFLARGPSGSGLEQVEWASTIRIEHGVVDRFDHGGVLLAGDAAHVHSPAGGMGMNTGVQDGYDAAASIAAVVRGADAGDALPGYGRRRRAAVQEVLRSTDRLLRFETAEGRFVRPAALIGLSTLGRIPALRRRQALELSCVTRVPWRTGSPPLPASLVEA